MSGISVTLLSKNCRAHLRECVDSLDAFIRPALGDEIVILDTGSTPAEHPRNLYPSDETFPPHIRILDRPDLCSEDMCALIEKYLPAIYPTVKDLPQFKGGFLRSFAEARQVCTDAAKNDLVFWIDSDDVLQGASALRDLCLDYFKERPTGALFLPYDYSFDADGTCNTVLWRERILNRTVYYWKGACHESMIPRDGRPQNIEKCGDPSCRINHKNGRAHEFSDARNYAILRRDYDTSEEWRDPRTEFYLGNACRGLKMWPESVNWYTKVLDRSGSRDDRLSAILNIGYIYLSMGRQWHAIDWFLQATKIQPLEPRAYYAIARCYHDLGRFSECLAYTQMGRLLGTPDHITSVDPNAFDFYPRIFETLALKELNQTQAAVDSAQAAASLRPNHPQAQGLVRDVTGWAQGEVFKKCVETTLRSSFSPDAAMEIVRRLKPEVRKNFEELQVETDTGARPPGTITFFCGKTLETWDPTSEDTGVGGSEKMVIQLARLFAKAGRSVEVYGNPKHKYRSFDKVRYLPAACFNPNIKRDVLILWRAPALLSHNFKANKIFVDMHDVANDADFTPDRMARCTGVFWKSKYHRSTAPSCPEDKCIYTRNGVDLSHFPTDAARNPKKIVYCSSGDRGLWGALNAVARIHNEFPDLELHTFYGFTPLYLKHAATHEYTGFPDLGHESHMLDYAERCFKLMDRLGVINHGRVGHKALAAHLSSANIWLYPTGFHEISCMSAMEAQVAGAIPVATTIGALDETLIGGYRITPSKNYEDTVGRCVTSMREILNGASAIDRPAMQAAARAAFDIQAVADQWLSVFAGEKVTA